MGHPDPKMVLFGTIGDRFEIGEKPVGKSYPRKKR